jgi:PKD repeat protein
LPSTIAAITGITVNPKNPAQVWVCFSGYNSTAKVYYSANGNTATPTWTNLSAGLPNLPANCIYYESGTNDGIYVGMDGGVYYRDNTTPGWVNFSSGLPNTVVLQLAMYNATHTMRAATFGRGSWGTPHWTNPTVAPVAMFSGYPTNYCINDTVHFTDTSSGQPTSWSWTFQSGNPATSTVQNPVVIYNTAGTYSVSLTATNSKGNNTLNQPSYITINPNPAKPVITQSGQVLYSNSSGTTYQWYFGGAPIAGATSSTYTFTPLPLGSYGVVVTNSFGCSSLEGTFTVTATTGINELSTNNSISLYPNPTNGNVRFTLNMTEEGDYTMSVSDVLGRTISSAEIHVSANYTGNLDMSGYSKGVYFISIKNSKYLAVKKLVVY